MSIITEESAIANDNPVNNKQAQAALGLSESYITALKKAMGIKGRFFFLSDVRKFMRANPNFRMRDVHPNRKSAHRVQTGSRL